MSGGSRGARTGNGVKFSFAGLFAVRANGASHTIRRGSAQIYLGTVVVHKPDQFVFAVGLRPIYYGGRSRGAKLPHPVVHVLT